MAYADYDFYLTVFHGTSIQYNQYERLAEMASDLIDGMVSIPVQKIADNPSAFLKVKKACAYIIESLDANGGIDVFTGMSASAAASESLGDYSISSAASGSAGTPTFFGDVQIPAIVKPLLQSAGLMSRWAYAGTVLDNGY